MWGWLWNGMLMSLLNQTLHYLIRSSVFPFPAAPWKQEAALLLEKEGKTLSLAKEEMAGNYS